MSKHETEYYQEPTHKAAPMLAMAMHRLTKSAMLGLSGCDDYLTGDDIVISISVSVRGDEERGSLLVYNGFSAEFIAMEPETRRRCKKSKRK